ncbi:glutathione S-transferase U17-like [Wolffia australiana]
MAQTEEVKVLGAWPSPFVMRARIALHLKKVDYEFIVETMNPKSELLLTSNPVHQKIPVLFHNGKPINESLVILQYIDETWTSTHPILPANSYDRAIARFWASYIDDKWFPLLWQFLKPKSDEEKEALLGRVFEGVKLLEEALRTCGKGGKWFGGDAVGYVDIILGSFLGWIRVVDKLWGVKVLDGDKFPSLVEWADAFCEEEEVKSVMPETEKLMEFAIARFGDPAPSK